MRRSSNPRRAATVLVAALAALAGGCSGAPPEPTAAVRGKVTLNGAPLAGVVVTFYPVSDSDVGKRSSRGTTDAGGAYRLADADGKPGAVVGANRVTVRWPTLDRGGSGKAPGPPIPLPYTVASETPLRVEVRAGQDNAIDLPLKK